MRPNDVQKNDNTMQTSRDYEAARKRVAEKKKFYRHLTTYLTMSAFFITLNMMTSPGHWWFQWPMLGWGIGIVTQYFQVFGFPGSGVGSAEWEEREIQKELGRGQRPANNDRLDLDDHLELREVKKEAKPAYRKDDLV
jgi:hypothetical protein